MPTRPRATQADQRVRLARGRHAPPPEVRAALQRQRLMRAAASEFAERGYAAATATSIAARPGMSKATFYEHFDNKLVCMLALYDRLGTRFASPHDAYAIVGGVTELISRHVRLRKPKQLLELAPVIDRLVDGVLARGSK